VVGAADGDGAADAVCSGVGTGLALASAPAVEGELGDGVTAGGAPS
jgi:hypothetical protein